MAEKMGILGRKLGMTRIFLPVTAPLCPSR